MTGRWLVRARGLLEGPWFIPTLFLVVFAGLGIVMADIVDTSFPVDQYRATFGGDAGAARSVLETVAGSLITVAGLTFSLTMVVLQLASSQYSPRVLQNVFSDRLVQVTIGVFVGQFAYSLLVLRAVRDPDSSGSGAFVPHLSITLAILLALVALVLLIVYIHHVAQLVQVSNIAAQIADRTLDQFDRLYRAGLGREGTRRPRPRGPRRPAPRPEASRAWFTRNVLVSSSRSVWTRSPASCPTAPS